MSRDELIERTCGIFARSGFQLSDRCEARPRSFDVAARRDDLFLLVKVLSNIEGLNEPNAQEMRRLAALFRAVPLVVGEKTKDKPLEGGTIYLRYGVPCVSPDTLSEYFVDGVPPLVYAAPGGLYVDIDGDRVRSQRLSRGISLGELAKMVGVSRRAVSKYEEGMNASVDVALRLEEVFDAPLAEPLEFSRFQGADVPPPETLPSNGVTPLERAMLTLLTNMGFRVYSTRHAPFDALSRDEHDQLLSGASEYSPAVQRRAQFMSSFSRLAGAYSVFIIEGHAFTDRIGDTLLLRSEEMHRISAKEQLLSRFH